MFPQLFIVQAWFVAALLKEFTRTNVDGTNSLVRIFSANKNPPPKFLFISSLAAREPDLSWYAKSKYLAEQIVADNSGIMPWTIFRPTAVYGPGDKELRSASQDNSIRNITYGWEQNSTL